MRPVLAVMIASSLTGSAFERLSPLVDTDRTVTFRLSAPEAHEVAVNCEAFGTKPMTRGDGGIWSYTSNALKPDLYTYTFTQDGKRITDPANPEIKDGVFGDESLLAVPGEKDAPWEIRDVPRGRVDRRSYRSEIAAHERPCYIYTPPGYDAKAERPYPVLYLLHGFSDQADAWSTIGRANVILDNLIAEKKAVPMVVVMPLGYGDMAVVAGGWEGRKKDNIWEKNLAAFDKTLVQEVIPLAEQHYHVRNDAAGRAVAGLSMGGAEALQAAFLHPDRFGWIGAFSSGGMPEDFSKAYPDADETLNDRFKLLWISCGKEDGLIGANHKLKAWLGDKKIRHSWTETEGAHNWQVWRRNLAAFAGRIFRD